MAEEIAFENGRISNFQGLVTLTLDRVILHTFVHHSSTSTYMPNFLETKKLSLWTDVRTDGRTDVAKHVLASCFPSPLARGFRHPHGRNVATFQRLTVSV